MISRWVSLALSVFFLVVLPAPLDFDSGLVANGTFSDATLGPAWTGSNGIKNTARYRTASPSLSPSGELDFSYYQCVDTSALAGSVDVSASMWVCSPIDGSIEIAMYTDASCTESKLDSEHTLVVPGASDDFIYGWTDFSETYPLPASVNTSVKITLNGVHGSEFAGLEDFCAYIDDVGLVETPATDVTLYSSVAKTGYALRWPILSIVGVLVLLLMLLRGRRLNPWG